MTYRVLIADEALDAVHTFLDSIAVTQQMPLTAARWREKALISQSGEIFLHLRRQHDGRFGQPLNETDGNPTPIRIADTLGVCEHVGIDGDPHGQFS